MRHSMFPNPIFLSGTCITFFTNTEPFQTLGLHGLMHYPSSLDYTFYWKPNPFRPNSNASSSFVLSCSSLSYSGSNSLPKHVCALGSNLLSDVWREIRKLTL